MEVSMQWPTLGAPNIERLLRGHPMVSGVNSTNIQGLGLGGLGSEGKK